MKNDKKILICLYVIIGFLLLNTVILAVKDFGGGRGIGTSSEAPNEPNNPNYDTSMFEELNLAGVVKLFDKNDIKIVYMGRSDCSACVAFLPTLQKAQDDYGFTTVYLDINTVDTSSSDFTKLKSKLNVNYTMDSEEGSVTKTFGEWYGYTPEVFIIKNKKMIDGVIGALNYDSFTEFLEKNDITK